jgi:hypothetical protein
MTGGSIRHAARVHAERRWPMAVAVLVAILLQIGSPHRGRVPGWWIIPVATPR